MALPRVPFEVPLGRWVMAGVEFTTMVVRVDEWEALQSEIKRLKLLVEDAFYEGYQWPDDGTAEFEDSEGFLKLGGV